MVFLLFAGFSTTTDLLGNGCAALAARPEQLAILRADPGLVPRAVEELLRFDAPVQMKSRLVHQPIEIGGRVIRPGRVLILHLGSANHDEDRFVRASELDVTRHPNPHVSFGGGGIHLCLGAALARAEAASVVRFIARRFASMEPAAPAVRRYSPSFRTYASVPIRIIRPGDLLVRPRWPAVSPGFRRRGRRPELPGCVDGTHEPDQMAVRVFDDGVPRSPEGVVGDLMTGVPGCGQLVV